MVNNVVRERFHLVACNYLGAGQFGKVYKCEREDGSIVALKRVCRENFMEREYETAMKIKGKSSFLVEFYEKEEIEYDIYIVMEFANNKV
jgi:serine/threonine protein kinase